MSRCGLCGEPPEPPVLSGEPTLVVTLPSGEAAEVHRQCADEYRREGQEQVW